MPGVVGALAVLESGEWSVSTVLWEDKIPRKWDGAICGLRRASPGSGWAGCGAGLEGAPAYCWLLDAVQGAARRGLVCGRGRGGHALLLPTGE